jgi:hypothetical protein
MGGDRAAAPSLGGRGGLKTTRGLEEGAMEVGADVVNCSCGGQWKASSDDWRQLRVRGAGKVGGGVGGGSRSRREVCLGVGEWWRRRLIDWSPHKGSIGWSEQGGGAHTCRV